MSQIPGTESALAKVSVRKTLQHQHLGVAVDDVPQIAEQQLLEDQEHSLHHCHWNVMDAYFGVVPTSGVYTLTGAQQLKIFAGTGFRATR